ncbi:MAG: hypothetical protein Ct9H90mP4_10790 [Gammaproteobacteria bacterium]|nr:MAG: hypothetical protein Ct9H90mP4_10790 [Gammaproteobacteria bacterium]
MAKRVFALLAGGGYAEYVCCPSNLGYKNSNQSIVNESASLPEVFATCWLNLFLEGKLHKDKTYCSLLGPGIGTAAIQLCIRLELIHL